MLRSHALADLASIQDQLARIRDLQSFRSIATGVSAALVALAAIAQNAWIASPAIAVASFLTLWLFVALACVLIVAGEMIWRAKLSPDGLLWQTHWRLTFQLLPSLMAGVWITWNFSQVDLLAIWLPETWGVIYGLGLWAAAERLPARARWAALWMLVSSAVAWKFGAPLAAWKMPFLFGIGQAILCFALIPEGCKNESANE